MKESDILQKVRLMASKLGLTLFRNNIGAYKHPKGYYIEYGVCNPGGSDLIGYDNTGRFIALEIKQPGKKPTTAQQQFLNKVNEAGGIGAVVTDPNDLEKILK